MASFSIHGYIGLVPVVLCEIFKMDDATLISAGQGPCASCSDEVFMRARLIVANQVISSHRNRALMRGALELTESLLRLPNARGLIAATACSVTVCVS